jgi:YfiH family protein
VTLPAPFRPFCEHLAIDLPGGRAVFTTRRGGASSGPYASFNLGRLTNDDPAAVDANRGALAALTGVPRERVAQGRQVHEAAVRRVTEAPYSASPPAEADGQATALPGVAPLVLTADCLPIALVAPEAVAMLHGGWRGLAAGVVEEGVRAVRELGATGSIAAAIGPGAGPCCYEAGPEVHDALGTSVGRNVDLKLAARRRLEAAGVAQVHDIGLCTMCAGEELFFSHRRDGGVTGRQAGMAWRT